MTSFVSDIEVCYLGNKNVTDKQTNIHTNRHNSNLYKKVTRKWHDHVELCSAFGSTIDNRIHLVSCPTHKKILDKLNEIMLEIRLIDTIPQYIFFFYNTDIDINPH